MTHPIPSPNSGLVVRRLFCPTLNGMMSAEARGHVDSMAATMEEAATLIEHLEHEKAELLRQLEVAREALTVLPDEIEIYRILKNHSKRADQAKAIGALLDRISRQALSNISGQG